MPQARTFAPRTAIAAFVVALAVAVPAVGTATAAASPSGGCRNANARPGQASPKALRAGTLCLLNRVRAAHGMRKLRSNRRLAKAARGHATDMVRRDYFAHNSLSGLSFAARIKRAGYMKRAHRWLVGENLGQGTGTKATPRAIARAWMRSPAHRRNILQRRFREVGIGIANGPPAGNGDPAATYSTEFGTRH